MTKILIIPGFENSGPQHWQSHFEHQYPGAVRVQQRDWFDASCDEWVARLDEEVHKHDGDVVLVGHSCGSMTIAFWGARHPRQIKGALIVAPTDTEQRNLPAGISGFAPIPRVRLPFPSIVVASRNDQWMDFAKAQRLATNWNSEFIDAGNAGHINTAAGFGPWPEGVKLLDSLLSRT